MANQEAVTVEVTNGTKEELKLCGNVDGVFRDWPLPPGETQPIDTASALTLTIVESDAACPQ